MVTLTKLAAEVVAKTMKDQDLDQNTNYIRVGVSGGGCSGFQYSMDIVNEKKDTDAEWEYEGIKLICDDKSLLYLSGTKIDFKDELMQKGFVFENPNSTNVCGCNQSFSV